MKEIVYSTKAKKDLKRYRHDRKKMEELFYVLDFLAQGKRLPSEYKPHMLQGKYKNHMECHVEDDLLLIWIDHLKDVVKVVRFGTHAEILRM